MLLGCEQSLTSHMKNVAILRGQGTPEKYHAFDSLGLACSISLSVFS